MGAEATPQQIYDCVAFKVLVSVSYSITSQCKPVTVLSCAVSYCQHRKPNHVLLDHFRLQGHHYDTMLWAHVQRHCSMKPLQQESTAAGKHGSMNALQHEGNSTQTLHQPSAYMQAKVIQSLGCAADVITIGHNSAINPISTDQSIVLPSSQDRYCCKVSLAAHSRQNWMVGFPDLLGTAVADTIDMVFAECLPIAQPLLLCPELHRVLLLSHCYQTTKPVGLVKVEWIPSVW